MKRVLGLLIVLCSAVAQGNCQNIEGQIIASQYGQWQVLGTSPNSYAFSPTSCRVQGGASFFFAFAVGTPIKIVDGNPSLNEVVTPTSFVDTNDTCAVSIAPVNPHQTPFSLTSATGGLQEALNQNMTTPATNTIVLSSAWYQLVGPANVNAQIAAAKGSTQLNLVDVTTTPYNWYQWNGSQYILVPLGGSAGNLGTRQADILANNQSNTAAVDQDIYIANSPTSGTSVYTPQQAATAANAHNGSAIIQPGAGRTPFTNPGNNRVLDLRNDVPATARNITEDGASCDTTVVYGTLVSGSNVVTLINTSRTAADIGKSIIAVGTTGGGLVTQFESVVTAVPDSLHLTITTNSPFNQSTAHAINLGHDDTAAIAKTMNTVGGGGTFVIPEGTCQSHTQALKGQSPIGLGIQSQLVQMPGEDLFQAPDPSQTSGVNQGAAHIHDIQFLFDSRIDATLPWQKCNDSGCTAQTPVYRPGAALTAVAANPLAPGWMVGASNGVASINSGSAVMCVPNAETPPAVGATVIFPYQTTIYTSTVASNSGSCSSGFTARTLNANLGITSAQAEWFAGSSVQNLSTSIGSGSCPTSITLSNSVDPHPGFESDVPPMGLIQIDSEQFSYFGRSNAGQTPVNTLYGIQCAQNGTSRAAHSSAATVFPLNRFKPAYPWPVIPSINSNDTTPAGTATYYPGWNAGNAVFAFPVASGAQAIGGGGWSANAHIEDLSFFAFPNEINGENWQEVNKTTLLYFVTPHYAATFSNWYGLYSSFGIFNGPPSLENHAYATAQPTGDGTHWDGMQIYASNPMIMAAGNQNSFANFNVYSNENTTAGAQLGADTCWYMVANHDDQNGSQFTALTLDHFKNIYCEAESGPHDGVLPIWEWDTYNSEIEDQHMGAGGEVYIGGAQQHWFGGNANNSPAQPTVVFGTQNTGSGLTNLGSEPKGNVYGTNSLINFGWGNDFSGTTAQFGGAPSGPYGGIQVGGRAAIPNQNGEAFFAGNTTAPFTSLEGGLVTPEEFNANFAFEAAAMSVGYTFDDTAPVTHSYTACNVGNNPSTYYCFTNAFNQEKIGVGPGQRIVNGKYTMYVSVKDVTAATNTWTFAVGTTCGGVIGTYNIPITNQWPSSAAQVFTVPIDFTGITTPGCGLGLILQGATTADQIRISYLAFAPVAEQFNAQTINVTNIITPGGPTGGTPTGCQQSPVVGIRGGFECPIKGFLLTLTGNQGSTDTSAAVNATSGLSPAGCFFVDTEYECYASITDGTHLGGLTRGQYLTTAATHNSGANVVAVPLVLGSLQQLPSTVVAYGGGGGAPVIFAVNNPFPQSHAAQSVFSVNNGSNEFWINVQGGVYQQGSASSNQFMASYFGLAYPFQPPITQSGNVLMANVPGTALQPQALAGGHAGSLNVIAPATIAAPELQGALPSGSTTTSWVCSGLDVDGAAIPGTTTTVTAAATWTYPQGISVGCPWTAGIVTFKIWRTAGGGSQGLIGTGTGVGNGYWVSDFGGATGGGTPPASNASNPHISVAGSGNPTITMGTVEILNGSGVPTGCGTTYGNGSIYSRTDGTHAGVTLLYICDAATTTWVAFE